MSSPKCFRAWNGQSMEYGGFVIHASGPITNVNPTLCDVSSTSPIMQFTGISDMYKKSIYEGDILKFDPEIWGSEDSLFAVEWDKEEGCWSGKGVFNEWSSCCSIVGNIYADPELIK